MLTKTLLQIPNFEHTKDDCEKDDAFDPYHALSQSTRLTSAMSHVSATNELPLSAISFVKHPDSPDEADKSALTFDHYNQNQARNEMSPLATNERPLSCTCLPKLLTDDKPVNHFQTKFDGGINDDEFVITDVPVLSSSCPLPHGHVCTPNENHINSADFRERLNAFDAWHAQQLPDSSAPRIFINDKLPKMSDFKVMIQTPKRINPKNALRIISHVPKHAVLFNKPIIVTSSTPHLSDPCTSNAFCHTKHYSIMPNNSSSSNSIASNIVTNDNNTTIPHPNIVKIHNSDATQTTQTSSTRRQRHSIAGQNLGFFKIMDIAGGFSRKMTTSTNSLFSTAVISGSSSAPNLHQINAASPSGIVIVCKTRRSAFQLQSLLFFTFSKKKPTKFK